jgi:hypothetical protein
VDRVGATLLGDADLDERTMVVGRHGEPPLELRHAGRLDDEVAGAGLERLGVADLVVVGISRSTMARTGGVSSARASDRAPSCAVTTW